MARKHKGQSKWGLDESILDVSKYSVGKPRLFQDSDSCIHLFFLALKLFIPARLIPISLCKWFRLRIKGLARLHRKQTITALFVLPLVELASQNPKFF